MLFTNRTRHASISLNIAHTLLRKYFSYLTPTSFCTKKKLILAKEGSITVSVDENELKSSLASQTKNTTLACNEGVVEKMKFFLPFKFLLLNYLRPPVWVAIGQLYGLPNVAKRSRMPRR